MQNGDGDKPESEADTVADKLGEMSVKSDSSTKVSQNKTDDEKKETTEGKSENKDTKEDTSGKE